MGKDEDGIKVDLLANAENKVLPISDQATSSLMNCKKESIKKGETKKPKALSRMKELLKWAASPKSDKPSKFIKVLHFRNRATLRVVTNDYPGNDDDDSNGDGGGNNGGGDSDEESPKISLRWDIESCCTTSSAFSSVSEPRLPCKIDSNLNSFPPKFSTSRKGNWITTDSDFVVLELRRDSK